MTQRTSMVRALATTMIVILPFAWTPAPATNQSASLSGSILSAVDHGPVSGARLHVGDPRSGKIYSSAVVDADGRFVVADIPSATYELAVESEGHLYVVATPLQLAPGQVRTVHVEVNPDVAPDPDAAEKKKKKGAATIWDNPLTAALIVIAAAVVVGLLLDSSDSDSPVTSQSMN